MKKLSIINVHDYPSRAQLEFAQRAAALYLRLGDWGLVAVEMTDARGMPANGCEMAALKWGHMTAHYSAYWDISAPNETPCNWHVRVYDYATNEVLAERTGAARNEEEGRRASQQWVLDNLERYRVEAA